jgi:hypothetical protein
MVENGIIFIIFSLALYYVGKTTFGGFFSKQKAGCAKGCASCGAVDFEKITNQIDTHK